MQKVLKVILVSFLIGIVACGKEEIEPPPSPYLGYWEVTSFTSDVAMDINQDGVVEYDFLKELAESWFENNLSVHGEHHISIRQSTRNTDILWLRSFGMPVDTYRPRLPTLHMRMGPEDTQKSLTIKDGQVVSFDIQEPPFDMDLPEHAEAFPRYTSIKFLDENTLETKMNQRFYDEEVEVWKDVSLIAVFSKITDPDYLPLRDY
ncbi:hypothetical protein [Christiangramia sp. SM2212]|uniref:Uncharacterized protein n=1 Tax=Christiangramia sediminicola TaxID=3073267 RepID=A0ABU1ERU1_9FLAO|nr:hypothetical protein [Christiangramia sp. SM2212]MDR5591094.1 hypothetical protein [Christiangramia sp. SM2212]